MKALTENLYIMRLIFQYSKKKVLLHFSINIMQAVMDFVTGIYFFNLLIRFIEQNYSFWRYFFSATVMLILQLIRLSICQWYFTYYGQKLDDVISEHFTDMLNKKALSLSLCDYETPELFNIQKRAMDSIENIPLKVLNNMSIILSFILISFITIIFVAIESPFVMLFLVFPLLYTIIGSKKNKFSYLFNKEQTQSQRKDQYVRESFFSKEMSKELRTSNLSKLLHEMFLSANNEMKGLIAKYGYKIAISVMLTALLGSYVPLLAANIYAAYRFAYVKDLSIAAFSIIITTINTFCNRLNRLSGFISIAKDHCQYISDIKTFLKLPETDCSGEDNIDNFKSLVCKDLCFSYSNDKLALNKINVTIRKGETVAVVGSNGAGKSTFIKLLLRLYEPTSGLITYNDKNISSYDILQYRSVFGVVFQDFILYGMSALENVLMSIRNDEEAWVIAEDALRKVGLLELIKNEPQGIHTALTREFRLDGLVLSGGQSQKVAVARLFARDFEIAVLDEPSASLDPISELEIMNRIYEAAKGKTVITITHRLSIATMADKILFFDKGQITECGSHNELMQLNGEYSKMFNMQAQPYNEQNNRSEVNG